MTGPVVPPGGELRARLAEALRQHRWLVEELAPLSNEDGYRPGAPCMDCGSYPGPIHDRSYECPRVLAKVLLPTVLAFAEAEGRRRAAEELNRTITAVQAVYRLHCPVDSPDAYVDRGAYLAHTWWETVLGGCLDDLRDRAVALAPENARPE